MRLQGVQAFGCARSLRPAANHEHRLRCRPYLPGPTARLSDRHRPDHLGRPPRLAHAGATEARAAGRLGSRSHSIRPPRREAHGDAGLMSGVESPSTTRWRPADLIVPVGSVGLLVLMIGLVLASAGKTLGYDYTCYEGAARRLVDGKPIYDNAFSIAVGTCPGTYTYPPAFAVALVPWLLFGGAAAGAWCLAMAACFLVGVALLPVRRDVRWLIVIVAALDWPLLYAVKLGQVEPILFLGFAAAWRWMDRPWAVGVATAGPS